MADENFSPADPTTPPLSWPDPEWRIADGYTRYPEALATMEDRVTALTKGDPQDRELVWLVEHPPLYTAGTSARQEDLLGGNSFPVYDAGRGGQYTYHGPGQRVGYLMLDLKRRSPDVRCYVHAIEEWLIRTLDCFNVRGERREDRVGIWVARGGGREDKIGAIGVRVRRWVTFHGFALNVEPDLSHFGGIVPCGIREHGVTSLWDLGIHVTMEEVDSALRRTFDEVFGRDASGPMRLGGGGGACQGM
ncbi:lipoyl(octanoyl) transferase LipB [Novispirillum itersonii]|uniref:Octanoyltransferase n=1 Tax=Novispirillum itersonii TaxID=189 RepID=A0A7W9ZHH0_NOVIT|nr:lipoyl(octanoyl) transferase LipB [Novispirillum itersonii]MBB6211552.1 lipoyl(octanoyl) transferase [Novispirillum itersonii]